MEREEGDLAIYGSQEAPAEIPRSPMALIWPGLFSLMRACRSIPLSEIGYQICPAHRRQGYRKAILRLGLEKARVSGLSRVLVTCNQTNIGS